MRLSRCCVFVLFTLLATVATAFRPPDSRLQPAVPLKQIRPLASFSQVDVQGRLNVSLHTGYKTPQLLLTGDMRDLSQLSTTITQNTLYISLGKGYPQFGPVNIEIRGQGLSEFRYSGAGIVKANRLYTPFLNLFLANAGSTQLAGTIGVRYLKVIGPGQTQISGISSRYMEIELKGNPQVQLSGNINLANLDLDGKACLNAHWLKSDTLKIRMRKAGSIELAGIVNRLDLELWGTAHFKGRYLRAQRSFVKAHDKSVAEIAATNHQSTLATDASDVRYYNLPVTRADFMAYNGAVLDLRDLSYPFIDEYTRYNKQFP